MHIQKKGSSPVYLTAYTRKWIDTISASNQDFEIKTSFGTGSGRLEPGKEVKLIADLTVKKKAEYVMINIPIPAGCSYGKKTNYGFNSHYEYHKSKVSIFLEGLKVGKYSYEINLLPRFTGSYTLNPAKVELMYFPVFSANNKSKRIEIE